MHDRNNKIGISQTHLQGEESKSEAKLHELNVLSSLVWQEMS